jgi:hypothetical protein
MLKKMLAGAVKAGRTNGSHHDARIVELKDQMDRSAAQIAALEQRLAEVAHHAVNRDDVLELIRDSRLIPALENPIINEDTPFMAYSTCTASDFQHPRYLQLCRFMAGRPQWQRKQWEWIFILHHLIETGALREGARGLGFGVGREPLPAAFALSGAQVVATDAPLELGQSSGWVSGNQHAQSLDALRFHWVPDDIFQKNISFQHCDMTAIDPTLTNFDFVWSSCCFEHLGSLCAGLNFVRNSVEYCLKPGGVAVHTTEFNLSSDTDTIEEDPTTVIYRRRDLMEFSDEMRQRGHDVQPFRVGPNATALDFHVDLPPHVADAMHIRLRLAGYSCTSAGLVIRRGD